MSLSEQTEFPDMFPCYWGSHKYDNNPEMNRDIISNRNYFIKKNNIIKGTGSKYGVSKNIVKRANINEKYLDTLTFDHIEFYTSNDKWIIIFSPYIRQDELADKYGFIQIPNLYSNVSFTYMKTVDLN
jgi:hypothetical protein